MVGEEAADVLGAGSPGFPRPSDYQRAWKFNPKTTHTFNVVEFPELASFTRFLWEAHKPRKYTELIGSVREVDDAGVGSMPPRRARPPCPTRVSSG